MTARVDNTFSAPAKRVMSLSNPESKMSKSDPGHKSRISITDSPETIRSKIKAAMTDSNVNHVSYDPVHRPGVANLLEIMSHLDSKGRSCTTLAGNYRDSGLRAFKNSVADCIIEELAGIRHEYDRRMAADGGRYLDHVAAKGADKARESAEETMAKLRPLIGY